MKYKINESPDSKKVELTLTMGEVRFLSKMVGSALNDVEEFGEDEFNKTKPLQKLTDVFLAFTHTEMSETEEIEDCKAWVKEFTKADYERAHGVKV